MRVLHVITKGDVGGAQTYVAELALAQRARGDDVTIAAGCDGPAMDRARGGGVDVEIVPDLGRSVAIRADVTAVTALRRLIRVHRPDVVHAHSSKGGLLARIAARREKVPSVYTAHGFPFQAGAPLGQRVMSLMGEWIGGRLGGAVICLTDEEEALARRWRIARRERVHVVPNGLPDTAPIREGPAAAVPTIIMVARFAPPKQQQALISVLGSMSDLTWRMVFVGDGPALPACRTAARSLGDRVEFLGHRDDAEELTAAADVAVLWSGYEGMPLALLEAMRAGLCCVASDLPGVRVLFGEPPAGLTAGDGAALEAALRSVVSDSNHRGRLGAAARRRYREAFTLDQMINQVDTVYEQVLAGI